MSCPPPVADPHPSIWRHTDGGLPVTLLPCSVPCPRKSDDIANDNTQLCRRSGIAIDPMFLS